MMLHLIDAVQPKKVVGDMLELTMTKEESVTTVRALASLQCSDAFIEDRSRGCVGAKLEYFRHG